MTTKQKVINEIINRYNNNQSLKTKDVPYKLYKSALKHFGSWKNAIIEAGLDYRSIVLNDKWSKERIKEEIRKIYQQQGYVKCNEINKELYNAILRIYGGFQNAVVDAGIEYNRKIHEKWSKEKILKKIKEIYNNGEPLNAQYIKKNYQALYNVCNSKKPLYFGSWAKAVEAAGINYQDVIKLKQKPIKYWTKERILKVIKERYKQNKSLLVKDMVKEYGGICAASYKYFGNWQNTLIKAGVDINKVYNKMNKPRNYWTKEKVIMKIKKLNKKGIPLNYSNIQKNYGGLMINAVKNFGSWENALKTVGIDYDKVNLKTNQKKWSKEKVIERLLEIKKIENNLTSKKVMQIDKKTHSAIYRYFKNWDEVKTILEQIKN